MVNEDYDSVVQAAADYSGLEHEIYQRKDGAFMYCAKGNANGLKMALSPTDTLKFIRFVKPSYWPKEETK